MSDEGSVTLWIEQLKQGDQNAAQQIWERYWQKLVRLAAKKRGGAPNRAVDAEDAALSALDLFCRGAQEGRFPQLDDRDDLWQLLIVLTARKTVDHIKHEMRQKRGGGKVQGESVFLDAAGQSQQLGIDQVAGGEPTPSFAMAVAEQYDRRIALLDSESLETVAQLKLEGYSVEEIAGQLECSNRTIKRKLALIRKIWSEEEETVDFKGPKQDFD